MDHLFQKENDFCENIQQLSDINLNKKLEGFHENDVRVEHENYFVTFAGVGCYENGNKAIIKQ